MSEKHFKRYMVTAALPYANGPLHLGHIAGAYLPADIFVRYLRKSGKDVCFISGSDEHGAAITIKAQKEGTTPKKIIDHFHTLNKKTFEDFGIAFDLYHRTSQPIHHETSQDFFKKLYEDGQFDERETEQYFDEEAQQFLADRYIVGTCPKCSFENAYGDQCENCGSSLSPTDLISPRSTLSGKTPVLKRTKHWYLPMDRHEDWVREYIVEGQLDGKQHHHPEDWKNHVLGQCKSWIEGGLQPRAMTRDLDWGVRVPLEHAEGKVLYVWLDAPIGYISATKDWAEEKGKNWEDYWRSEESCLIHFIGKDNIVFHCIIFPIILKLYGGYALPHNVPANEFLNLEGNKLSTSRNWAVWVHEYLQDFPDKQDVLRYVLTSIAPENKDSEFTWKDFQARNNNELVAVFGNFVNRALVLTQKYFDGKVPERVGIQGIHKELCDKLGSYPEAIGEKVMQYKFKEALSELMNLAREGNKYLADTEPWKLIKTQKEETGTVLNLALQLTAALSILAEPFLPFTAEKIRKMLNIDEQAWQGAASIDLLPAGHEIGKPALLFEKIDDATIQQQIDRLLATQKAQSSVAPAKPTISFEEFEKMDIRVGTILEAKKVPKTKKLMQLKIDTGLDQRTVVSGIAEHYTEEELLGQQVSVLVNLAPRKLRGILSEGMVLMSEDGEGKLRLAQPAERVPNGSVIR